MLGAACSGGAGGEKAAPRAEPARVVAGGKIVAPTELAGLTLAEPTVVTPAGALNPTTAHDPRSGAVYVAWAEEIPGVAQPEGKDQQVRLGDKWIPYGDVKLSLDRNDHAWVVFEDRRAEEDQIRLVRVDPERRAASFSAPWPGTVRAIVARPAS